jgi:hypothetical protein
MSLFIFSILILILFHTTSNDSLFRLFVSIISLIDHCIQFFINFSLNFQRFFFAQLYNIFKIQTHLL